MANPELKQKLATLLKENEEDFVDILNEVLVEEWLKDEEDDFFIVDTYSSNWPKMVREKVAQEIGEKYVKSPSKFAIIISTFTEQEVVDRGSNKIMREVLKKDEKALEEIKELVKYLDKEKGEEW